MKTNAIKSPRTAPDAWRLGNAGRVLGDAVTRFESRVLQLMTTAGHSDTRLSHVNLTRHLDLEGTRITELARRARMTNAAMTELIDQCERMGLVLREVDPDDKRARTVQFTEAGREWLKSFGQAVKKAEREMLKEIGPEAAEVLLQGLARYAGTVESIRVADTPLTRSRR